MDRLNKWGALLLVLSLTIGPSGCSRDPDRLVHPEGAGPLSASSAVGSFALKAPKRFEGTWLGTFGAYLLCSSEPGIRIRLERVTWRSATDAPPREVTPWIRIVDDTTQPTYPAQSILGLPWKSTNGLKFPGQYSRIIQGRLIGQPCSEVSEDVDPKTGALRNFTELLVVIESDANGADVSETYIDYRASGKAYRLEIEWDMVTCGLVIKNRPGSEQCR